MTGRAGWLGGIAGLLAVFLALAPGTIATAADGLTVLFSGDVRGSYEGCDCQNQPLGGLAQRAFLVGQRRQPGSPALVVDAGNLLFRTPKGLGDDAEAWRRTGAMLLTDAYSLLGVDAVNVGPNDLASGLEYLQRLARRASFPLLSTNLVDPATDQPVFTSVLHLDRAGERAAVIGLLPGEMSGQGFRTLDPVATARDAVADARAQGAERIIVLSALGLDDERRLARKVKGIDLIVGAGDRSRTDPAPRVKATVIAHVGSRGKYLGHATLPTDGGAATVVLVPVESGGPVDEEILALVEETRLRLGSPDFVEAGRRAVPP
jgi:2',3'-cyclic-nucleotide 2'-phosphodiesterase (5'-nucleotidase family)